MRSRAVLWTRWRTACMWDPSLEFFEKNNEIRIPFQLFESKIRKNKEENIWRWTPKTQISKNQKRKWRRHCHGWTSSPLRLIHQLELPNLRKSLITSAWGHKVAHHCLKTRLLSHQWPQLPTREKKSRATMHCSRMNLRSVMRCRSRTNMFGFEGSLRFVWSRALSLGSA